MRSRLPYPALILTATLILGGGCHDSATGPESAGTGSLRITVDVTGNVPDANGFLVATDGEAGHVILAGGRMLFSEIPTGSHVVALGDVADQCTVDGDNPRVVSITSGDTTTVDFAVACAVAITSHVFVDKIAAAMVVGSSETIEVHAVGETGAFESWTVTSADPSVATVSALDSVVAVTGQALGSTTISILGASGETQEIPIRVYDPTVLETGELTLRYVTTFTCRWDDRGSGGSHNGSFYHPVVDSGYHALGSLATSGYGCPSVDGKEWMIEVKAAEGSTALAPPVGYTREYIDAGSGANKDLSVWTPVCPAGYVPMGSVVANDTWAAPSLDDVTCVREDLTKPGEAAADFTYIDDNTGASDWLGTWRITISDMAFHDNAWLETGTFVGQGSEASCSGSQCYQRPLSHPVMNVLAVDLPVLVDRPLEAWVPRLTGYEQPTVTSSPLMQKTFLVPFTALLGGVDFSQGDIQWLLLHSPMVRVERQVYHKLMFHTINLTSLVQENSLELVSGVTTTNAETFSHTVGVSITVETGAEFLGAGGKVSATMSYQFGYSTMHSVASLQEQHINVTIYTQQGKAAACWQQRNVYVVKRHNGTRLDTLAEMEFGIDSYVVDEFPNRPGT
jgi:hypothetical protein